MIRLGPRFARIEPRRRAGAFMRGLMAGVRRANCWAIAEHAGEADPRGMQQLRSSAVWDDAGGLPDLRCPGRVRIHRPGPLPAQVLDRGCAAVCRR